MNRLTFIWRVLVALLRPWPLGPANLTPWLREDALALAAFFEGALGRKLIWQIRAVEQAQNVQAVQKGTPWQCGFAAGWRCHAAWLIHGMAQCALGRPEDLIGAANGLEPEGVVQLAQRLTP